MTPERRAELTAEVFSTDRRDLRGEAAVWTVAAFGAGMVTPLAGLFLLPRAWRAWRNYWRREWHLGALLADERARRRERERIPHVDARVV